MRTVQVIALLNGDPVLLAPDKGTRVKDEVKAQLEAGNKVVLDFTGYKFISSTFLNHLFGQLILEMSMSAEALREKVEILGLSEDDREDVELTLYNAQQRQDL